MQFIIEYDVFLESTTIASMAMKIFRAIYMQEGTIGVVPEYGYEKNERARFLDITTLYKI